MRLITLLLICLNCFCLAQASDVDVPKGEAIPAKAYTIQVFSSKDKQEAKEYGVKYTQFNNTFLWPKMIRGEIWYRVCVGIFPAKVDADARLKIIKQEFPKTDAYVNNLINN